MEVMVNGLRAVVTSSSSTIWTWGRWARPKVPVPAKLSARRKFGRGGAR